MRGLLVIAMFLVSLANAAWQDYTEVRELRLDTDGIKTFILDVGAGSLDVTGVAGSDRILVMATIKVDDGDDDARKLIEKRMSLTLDSNGSEAILIARFEQGMFGTSTDASIDLEVQVPEDVMIRIDDGSGSIDVRSMSADVAIDDGSGSIDVNRAGSVSIDDGSGSILVSDANGDVNINDGSGSITVRNVQGSVRIDDGSGGIDVDYVEHDLVIIDDGSGSLTYANVKGSVEGDIEE